jgi:outer membrane protein insertion porin family
MESAWFSTDLVTLSRERLERLGYFKEVSVETPAVPGSTDQVDVNVHVEEKPTGNLLAGVGYSQSGGVTFNASVSQDNFLGTGKQISLAFNNNDINTAYRLAYTNPYYTVDGISRGFDFSYKETDFNDADTADYATDVGYIGVNFGIPLNEFDRIRFDFSVSHTDFHVGTNASTEVRNFVALNGDSFLNYTTGVSWSRDSRDKSVFPTKGGLQALHATVTLPGSDLTYYKLNYLHKRFFPITNHMILATKLDLGYGNGYSGTKDLPFYDNYFTGGPKSVRGYKGYSLGPREAAGDQDPLGGNLKVVGSVELMFPAPFGLAPETMRLGTFVDVGNVYDTNANDFKFGELRYSVGVSLRWMSPMGALGVSLAAPLNKKSIDDTEVFQFTFGSSF